MNKNTLGEQYLEQESTQARYLKTTVQTISNIQKLLQNYNNIPNEDFLTAIN